MQHRHLGRSGLRVPRLALGTMTWGKDTDADEATRQLTAYIEAGGTLVDTADVYTDADVDTADVYTDAEQMLGALVGDVVDRDDIIIATKAVARRDDGPFGGGASRGALLTALNGSLRRLDVDHIDLWQLHAWDTAVPIEETLSAIDAAATAGKIRYAGISNYTGWQLATAAAASTFPLVSTQVEYSLLERGIEREVVPAANHHGLGILCWAPLGRGVLTGKYRNATPPDSRGSNPHYAPYVEHHRSERAARIVQAVVTAADGLGTTPLAVALAWVRDRPGVATAVVGARDTTQLHTSLAAEDLTLPPAIRAALDDVSDIELGYPERPLG